METNPAAIKQFVLERIDGLTVRASGLFQRAERRDQQINKDLHHALTSNQTPNTVILSAMK